MARFLLVMVVMGAGVGMALLIKDAGGAAEDPVRREVCDTGRETPDSFGRAGFYLDLTPEEKVVRVQEKLRFLTSAAATDLGGLKEDIALLADEPPVIDTILEAFAARADLTRFEGSGFGDLFELIRHERFVAPVMRLFESPFPQVRNKAVRASLTQKDARLVPLLETIYDEALAAGGATRGHGVRERALLAAEACGGHLLPGLVLKALEDPAPTVRSQAIVLAGRLGFPEFIPRLRLFLSDPDPHMRMGAAVALAREKDPAGLRSLIAFLDPREPELARDAMTFIRELRAVEAIPQLKRILDESPAELYMAYAGTLVVLGDEETLKRMVDEIDAEEPERRMAAVISLAASGRPEHRELLLSAVREGGPSLHQALSLGLVWAPEVDLGLVEAILPLSVRATDMVEVLMRLGDAIVPSLARMLGEETDELRILSIVSALANIGTVAARRALLAHHQVHPRLIEEGVRKIDLRFRKEGIRP